MLNYRRFVCWAAAFMAVVCVTQTNARAATINSISTLPLNDGTYYTGINGDPNPPNYYQKPGGLVVDALAGPTNGPGTWSGTGARGVRSPRNNAQSFTIDADVNPYGVDVTAFVIQFLKRGNSTDTFGIELFSVADANASSIPVSVTNLLSDVSALSLPTAASLGITPPGPGDYAASGTAIFHLDEPLLLAPGAYVWRFLPSWSASTAATYFDWGIRSPGTYDGGRAYEENNNNSFDYYLGVIGTAAVPEPSGIILAVIGLAGVGCLRRRRWR